MDPEALLVVCLVAVVLGLPLFGIGWLAARWYHRKNPESNATTRHITRGGALLFGSMVVTWVLGLIWAAVHPAGVLSRLLTYGGIEVYVVVLGAPFIAVGVYFESRGSKFVSTKEDRA